MVVVWALRTTCCVVKDEILRSYVADRRVRHVDLGTHTPIVVAGWSRIVIDSRPVLRVSHWVIAWALAISTSLSVLVRGLDKLFLNLLVQAVDACVCPSFDGGSAQVRLPVVATLQDLIGWLGLVNSIFIWHLLVVRCGRDTSKIVVIVLCTYNIAI